MEEKRARDGDEEDEDPRECLKKLCRGLGIVEEEHHGLALDEEGNREVALEESSLAREELLSGVIKSLEEEINLSSGSSSPAPVEQQQEESCQEIFATSSRLSYLLEASDDELGIASPALSEADLSCSLSEQQIRANTALDLLEGEVISLGFPEFEEEWIRRAVATMEMVMESSSVELDGSSTVAGIESPCQPLLVESSGSL
ncbi:hypothetical protein SELMODRAFT_438558 [Selaginella moellendorffii]|uniref:Uncharacterized protein n=1 Tax=Selaginella moellendorffii TaxID=88036 RepID=D8QWQ9_SELML|nr:hypothetical protein SELMODRAFT_438558 [Selaginella moellendorffii]